jgi:hypothetical protein
VLRDRPNSRGEHPGRLAPSSPLELLGKAESQGAIRDEETAKDAELLRTVVKWM